MKTFVVEGVVLKRRNVGEADRILTVFTKTHGKLVLKAVGVRKIASKRSSHIELLNRVSMSVYQGKGMPILTEATAINSFPMVKDDLTKIGFAYHLCELVDGLCPEGQENSAVFTLLTEVLQDLPQAENLSERIHAFEVSLLATLGYWSPANANISYVVESILERKLKTIRMLPRLFAEEIDNVQ